MNFCPKCGKKGIVDVLCGECSAEKATLEFKRILLKVCIGCRSYLFQNKWTGFSRIDEAIKRVVQKSVRRRFTGEIIPILPDIQFKPGINYDFEVEIRCSPREKYFIPARIEMTTCPKCGKGGTQYFEGILQLRNPSDDVVDFIRREVKKERGKGIHINAEKKIPGGNGIDFYFTSQRYIQNLGRKLQNAFGGILKINSELFSRKRQTSKDIYRINVLFELLDFRHGDVVVDALGRIIKVTEIGKTAIGSDLVLNKKTSFDYRKKDYKVLEKKRTRVVKIYPRIEVLDPDTYQGIEVYTAKDTKPDIDVDDEVDVVISDNKAYIV